MSFINETQHRLAETTVRVAQEMAADNEMRMGSYTHQIEVLNEGVYYPNQYYSALKTKKQTKRLEWHKQKGNFFHGYASSKYFEQRLDPRNLTTGIEPYSYRIKRGVLPHEALAAFRKGPSLISCGDLCQTAFYEAIREVLGNEKFDLLFAADSPTPFHLGFNTPSLGIYALIIPAAQRKKGDLVYFTNASSYCERHVNGEARGYVTICMSNDSPEKKYTTLGLSSQGVTVEAMKEVMLQECNAVPIGMEIVTEDMARRIIDYPPAERAMTMQELEQQGGGTILASLELNAERIDQLAKASLEKARRLFTQWHKDLSNSIR
jgi:hypothetical protein